MDEKNMAELSAVTASRDRVIVRTSVIGIAANLFLAVFKAAAGYFSNSIAVTLDAVNNLSDALSSVVTIIGTKLALKKPDKRHPLGYGRVEYLSAMIVSGIVLYAGISSLIESIKNIIQPQLVEHSGVTLIVLGGAIVVKLVLGQYVKRMGKKVNSGALEASGTDALSDAILSLSVLVSAAIYMLWGINLEAYVGVVISVFILKAGLEILSDTLDDIVGKRVDRKYTREIKKTIAEGEEKISGVFDLILHSYGPEKYIGSVHVEVPDTMTAEEIDLMERRIAERVLARHGVILTGIGIYSKNTRNDAVVAIRGDITRRLMVADGVLQIHGFYVDLEKKIINMDVILDFEVKDREKLFAELKQNVQNAYPEYTINMSMDLDI